MAEVAPERVHVGSPSGVIGIIVAVLVGSGISTLTAKFGAKIDSASALRRSHSLSLHPAPSPWAPSRSG